MICDNGFFFQDVVISVPIIIDRVRLLGHRLLNVINQNLHDPVLHDPVMVEDNTFQNAELVTGFTSKLYFYIMYIQYSFKSMESFYRG